MTLILSVASPFATMQVADRLVSVGGKPLDREPNKTVIYFARDGIVSCSYTGLAFLGADPVHSDTWVMEALTGATYPREAEEGWGFASGPFPADWPTVAQALDRLEAGFLDSLMRVPANWRAEPFELALSGWVEAEGERPRPILCGFERARGASTCQKYWHEATQPGKHLLISAAPEGNLKYGRGGLAVRLQPSADDAPPFDAWAQRAIDTLVDEVQHTSRQIPGVVGPDCMTVLIPHLSRLEVRVRYRSPLTPMGALVNQSGEAVTDRTPILYSPWIIGPGFQMAPSVSIGGGEWNLGGFKVNIEGPPSSIPGLVFSMSHQRRKPFP